MFAVEDTDWRIVTLRRTAKTATQHPNWRCTHLSLYHCSTLRCFPVAGLFALWRNCGTRPTTGSTILTLTHLWCLYRFRCCRFPGFGDRHADSFPDLRIPLLFGLFAFGIVLPRYAYYLPGW